MNTNENRKAFLELAHDALYEAALTLVRREVGRVVLSGGESDLTRALAARLDGIPLREAMGKITTSRATAA